MIRETFRWLLKRYAGALIMLLALGLILPSALRLFLLQTGLLEPVNQAFEGHVAERGLYTVVFHQLTRWAAAGIGISLPLGYFGPQLLRGGTRSGLMVASWGILLLLCLIFALTTAVNLLLEGQADVLYRTVSELLNFLWYGLLGLLISNIFLRLHWVWGVAASAAAIGLMALQSAVLDNGPFLPLVLIPLLAFLSVSVLRRAVPPVVSA